MTDPSVRLDVLTKAGKVIWNLHKKQNKTLPNSTAIVALTSTIGNVRDVNVLNAFQQVFGNEDANVREYIEPTLDFKAIIAKFVNFIIKYNKIDQKLIDVFTNNVINEKNAVKYLRVFLISLAPPSASPAPSTQRAPQVPKRAMDQWYRIPLNTPDGKQTLSLETQQKIRDFYDGEKQPHTTDSDDWAVNDRKPGEALSEIKKYLQVVQEIIEETINNRGSSANENELNTIKFLTAAADAFESYYNGTAGRDDKIIPIMIPYSDIAKARGEARVKKGQTFSFDVKLAWDFFKSGSIPYLVKWFPCVMTISKAVLTGVKEINIYFYNFKTSTTSSTSFGKKQLWILHTYINYFPGPTINDKDVQESQKLASLLDPNFQSLGVFDHLVQSPTGIVRKIQKKNKAAQAPAAVQAQATPQVDVTCYKRLLSVIDTYHDFDKAPGFLDGGATGIKNTEMIEKCLNEIRSHFDAQKYTQLQILLLARNLLKNMTLETGFFHLLENSKELENILVRTKIGHPTLSVTPVNPLSYSTNQLVPRYALVELGPANPDNKPNRVVSKFFQMRKDDQKLKFNSLLNKFFACDSCKFVIDRSTVPVELYSHIEYTGASRFDGSVNKNITHAQFNGIAVSVSKGNAELFFADKITVDPNIVDVKVDQKQMKHNMNNGTWAKCRPNRSNDDYSKTFKNECFKDSKALSANDFQNLIYDFKRSGDALQVVSCHELQKLLDATGTTRTKYVFVTHDKVALLHARLLRLNVVYTSKDPSTHSRILHLFRHSGTIETSEEKYSRYYNGVKGFFDTMSTFGEVGVDLTKEMVEMKSINSIFETALNAMSELIESKLVHRDSFTMKAYSLLCLHMGCVLHYFHMNVSWFPKLFEYYNDSHSNFASYKPDLAQYTATDKAGALQNMEKLFMQLNDFQMKNGIEQLFTLQEWQAYRMYYNNNIAKGFQKFMDTTENRNMQSRFVEMLLQLKSNITSTFEISTSDFEDFFIDAQRADAALSNFVNKRKIVEWERLKCHDMTLFKVMLERKEWAYSLFNMYKEDAMKRFIKTKKGNYVSDLKGYVQHEGGRKNDVYATTKISLIADLEYETSAHGLTKFLFNLYRIRPYSSSFTSLDVPRLQYNVDIQKYKRYGINSDNISDMMTYVIPFRDMDFDKRTPIQSVPKRPRSSPIPSPVAAAAPADRTPLLSAIDRRGLGRNMSSPDTPPVHPAVKRTKKRNTTQPPPVDQVMQEAPVLHKTRSLPLSKIED
jgi:hypothetical protein